MLRAWNVLYIFTLTCASRHNDVHFFDSSTSKALRPWGVLCILTSKCASRHMCVQLFIFHLASWLRTRRLASLLFNPPGPQNTGNTQCFASFLPFRAPASSLVWLSPSLLFSLLTFSTSEFLPGSASSWLCFSSVHIVGILVSKLPSVRWRLCAYWIYVNTTIHCHVLIYYVVLCVCARRTALLGLRVNELLTLVVQVMRRVQKKHAQSLGSGFHQEGRVREDALSASIDFNRLNWNTVNRSGSIAAKKSDKEWTQFAKADRVEVTRCDTMWRDVTRKRQKEHRVRDVQTLDLQHEPKWNASKSFKFHLYC